MPRRLKRVHHMILTPPIYDPRMEPRKIAQFVAAGRVGFGAMCLMIPRVILGQPAREASGPMVWMIRAFGIRDIVLGAGALNALNNGQDEATWVKAGAVADTADAITAVAFARELGGASTAATLSLAVPAAGLGWFAASHMATT